MLSRPQIKCCLSIFKMQLRQVTPWKMFSRDLLRRPIHTNNINSRLQILTKYHQYIKKIKFGDKSITLWQETMIYTLTNTSYWIWLLMLPESNSLRWPIKLPHALRVTEISLVLSNVRIYWLTDRLTEAYTNIWYVTIYYLLVYISHFFNK